MLSDLRISRTTLVHNVRAFRRILAPTTQLMVVVKGNAYGHGVGECAPIFASAGADWFGVASLQEALALRSIVRTKPILVLSYLDGSAAEIRRAIRQRIRLPVYTTGMLQRIERCAKCEGCIAKVHVKFDTGTTRVGFLPKEMQQFLNAVEKSPHVLVEGVYSHFAEVESMQQKFSQLQHERFATLTNILEKSLGRRLLKHMDCSAGALVHPDAHFDMVRIGISAYGIYSVADTKRVQRQFPGFRLRPALTWRTKLIQVKRVPAGTTIGYNRTFRCRHATTIGVMPIGYWEGLDRKLSNVGVVGIGKSPARIRGRVCMNLTMIEIPKVVKAHPGTVVTVIGQSNPVEVLAKQSGTIAYEVLTRINPLIPRRVTP